METFTCSIDEATQNFLKVTQIVEKEGKAIIVKNNKPKYILIDIESNPIFEISDDEKIDIVAKRILKKYKDAFIELAK